MQRRISDYRLFLREFRQTFRTTGAVLPSGAALSRALAGGLIDRSGPCRILEVGPGTGAVTAEIVRRMGPLDTLDLVELNPQFVARLGERFDQEPAFRGVAPRARVLHQAIETVVVEQPYDVVISGLPLNNFSVSEVENILAALVGMTRTGGTLSFFEYIAIRRLKTLVSHTSERQRLQGIGRALDGLFAKHPTHRQWIWPNIPPAWVHRVTLQGAASTSPHST